MGIESSIQKLYDTPPEVQLNVDGVEITPTANQEEAGILSYHQHLFETHGVDVKQMHADLERNGVVPLLEEKIFYTDGAAPDLVKQ